METKKTIEEINAKILKGEAVVMTAEEVSRMSKELSPKEICKRVDVVTTATFGPMCSSGVFINFGHSTPPIRMEKTYLNGVRVYSGVAAVDSYIGATSESKERQGYGGAHVIEELIAGKDIHLKAYAKGTDCYPRKEIEAVINKNTVNEIFMFNARNAYQNYNVATNTTKKVKYTYMGNLLPNMGNANYSTSGELSPLINDPELRTIGVGTRIFLCGAQGFVAWNGTQFNTSKPKNKFDIPIGNATTISVIGDVKQMTTEFLRAAYFEKYGVSIFIGIGIPIPVLDEDLARRVSIGNHQIDTNIFDYGNHPMEHLGTVNYAQLRSGEIEIRGKKVKTAPLSSLKKARDIAQILRNWILDKNFMLTAPVQHFPVNTKLNSLVAKENKE